jgi:pimeloyl-ACP methyl ester carboxylesterase
MESGQGAESGGLPRKDDAPVEYVLLVHGLARSNKSMKRMEKSLVKAGYATFNLNYPSTSKSVEEIAEYFFLPAVQRCFEKGAKKVHCVTHSMGGIVLRFALQQFPLLHISRVVMLSPPNQGSLIAEKLKDWWLFQLINGTAGQQLGLSKDSLPGQLGAIDAEVGIITGSRHCFFDHGFASFFDTENDGKVSVSEARLAGMKDFLVVPETHPFIMNAESVIVQTIHFLKQGHFNHLS